MQLEGIIMKVGDIEQVSEKFRVRLVVIEYESGQFKNIAAFRFTNEAADKQFPEVGTSVVVDFEPVTREWNGKYYTDLRAWKIEEVGAVSNDRTPLSELKENIAKKSKQAEAVQDDLPF